MSVSCTVWEKTPISIEEAVGNRRVKIISGRLITLQEAVHIDEKMKVVFRTKVAEDYDYIINYEDHYFGFKGVEYDSLNPREIKSIFIANTLKEREYKEIILVENEAYYGLFDQIYQIDTSTIYEVRRKSKEDSQSRTAYALLTTLLSIILTPVLIGLLFWA